MEIKITNSEYVDNQGYETLALWLEIDGRKYVATVHAEPKPGVLRHGLIFLHGTPPLREVLPPITINRVQYKSFTRDRNIFKLAIAFGLEVRYGRFRPGGKVVETPNPEEVKQLGERLELYAEYDPPPWEELTNFA